MAFLIRYWWLVVLGVVALVFALRSGRRRGS
jgi:hypothetical protein